jgi:hypothetical protein
MSSAVCRWSESLTTRNHTLLFVLGSLSVVSYGTRKAYGGRIVPSLATVESAISSAICQWSESRLIRNHILMSAGFPFLRLLRLAGFTLELKYLSDDRTGL